MDNVIFNVVNKRVSAGYKDKTIQQIPQNKENYTLMIKLFNREQSLKVQAYKSLHKAF